MKPRSEVDCSESLASWLYEKGLPIDVATDIDFIDSFFENDSVGCDIVKLEIISLKDEKSVRYFVPEAANVYKTKSWILKFQNQLKSFRRLQDDWNGYGSLAPNSIAIRNSQTVLDILHVMNFSPIAMVPSAEEGVAISFAKGKRRAIIECYNDGNIAAAKYEIDREPLVWNVGISEEDIKESIIRIYDFIN
jgi:hypothetical protein